MSEIRHGTYAGYQQHTRRRIKPCLPCTEAARRYMARWRKQNLKGYAKEKQLHKAHSRALWRLAALHRAEFDQLVADELASLGTAS